MWLLAPNILVMLNYKRYVLLCIFLVNSRVAFTSLQMHGIWLKTYELIWTDTFQDCSAKIVLTLQPLAIVSFLEITGYDILNI